MIGAQYLRGAALGLFAAVAVFGGVQTWRVDRLKADNVKLGEQVKAATETVRLAEALRGQEQTQDKASFAGADQRCDDRVNTAREAGAIIKDIVHAPAFTQAPAYQGPAADRPLVSATQLRGIIGQARDGEAVGLPAGGNSAKAR